MVERVITVSNRAGIHARPAALLVQIAKDFTSNIFLARDKDRINGKSIMGVITLGATYGTPIRIIAEGEDEQAAVEAIVKLFEAKFEED